MAVALPSWPILDHAVDGGHRQGIILGYLQGVGAALVVDGRTCCSCALRLLGRMGAAMTSKHVVVHVVPSSDLDLTL